MNAKKTFAMVAVLCMVAACFVCVTDTGEGASNEVITSKDTVTLDVDRNFESNKKELSKLGITSEENWTKEKGTYKLILDNVNFETTANIALCLVSESSKDAPGLTIELKGDNRIVSGSVDKGAMEGEERNSTAIFATHLVDGKHIDDFVLKFTGDGNIATDNNAADNIYSAFGIFVHGSLVLKGATVYANAGKVVCEYDSTFPNYVRSMGVYVTELDMTSDMEKKSVLIANSDGLDIDFTAKQPESQLIMQSMGVYSTKYIIEDSIIRGQSGKITWDVNESVEDLYASIDSYGIRTHVLADTEVEITNSKIIGCSNAIDGKSKLQSINSGISLTNYKGAHVDRSIIVGNVYDCDSIVKFDFSSATGVIINYAKITASLIIGNVGNIDGAINNGMSITNDSLVEDSILIGKAGDGTKSRGIYFGTGADSKTTITNTDMVSNGKTSSVFVKGTISVSEGYRSCVGINNGKSTHIEPTAVNFGKYTEVQLFYKYDVIFYNKDYSVMNYTRCDSPDYTFTGYTGYVPDGMKVSKCLDEGGKVLSKGSEMKIDDIAYIEVVFEEKSSGGFELDNTAMIAIVTGALAVFGAFALFLICFWDRRRYE